MSEDTTKLPIFPDIDEEYMRASPAPVIYPSNMEISSHHNPYFYHQENHDNRLLLEEEQKMVDIENPHHNDVLCGRGVTTNRHPGNESFRSLVGLNKELYVSSTKRQKMSISRSIVEAVRSLDPPGRFLEKDPNTGLWSDIGHKKAVEKTSQALRDGAASLRKQLSADLGDPEFLNAVFDMNEDENDNKDEASKKGTKDGKENAKKNSAEEKDDSAKTEKSPQKKAVEKAKVAKKAKVPHVKKGHRRTMSNPCAGSVSSKHHRRIRPMEPPPSPLARFVERNPIVPPSPRSPPQRSVSHPNSPMTWGGRVSFPENESPGSLGQIPSHSPYANPSSKSFSPYGYPPNHRHYGRGHSYQYSPTQHPPPEGRPPHPHSHAWSYGSPRYNPASYGERPPTVPPTNKGPSTQYSEWKSVPTNAYSGYPPAGSATPPRPPRPATPPPASPLPKGPLPPGRHQFSPAGYHTNPHPVEWSPSTREAQTYDRHHGDSPRYAHDGAYSAERSPRWRSPHPREYYMTATPRGYPTSGSSTSSSMSSGLSVPTLGCETKHSSGHMGSSPRVLLSPRSQSTLGRTPPRRPDYSPREFDPPPPSPRFRHVRPENHRSYAHLEDECRASPQGEEKKTDFDREGNEEQRVPYPSLASAPTLNLRPRQTPSHEVYAVPHHHQGSERHVKDDDGLEDDDIKHPGRNMEKLHRSSPTSNRINVAAAGTDAPEEVEDIAMSPIPMDREDPTSLMELPENILTLPISPCGPNDDPFVASSRP